MQLTFGRTCPKGSMKQFHLHQKDGASAANNWVLQRGRIAFPRRIAYFLNELRQPVVENDNNNNNESEE